MSKEYLEAFGRITLHTEYDNDSSYDCLNFEDDCKLVDEALQRLEAIDQSKPSEALEELEKVIEEITISNADLRNTLKTGVLILITKQALLELQSIKESKPSEALECLDYIENKLGSLRYECERTKNHRCDDLFIQEHIFANIKNYILKAKEQEKVLKIIKEKEVCLRTLKDFIRRCVKDEFVIQSYNAYVGKDRTITQKEFELLKRWLG